ncbi:hypothetical protein [Streptomyces candidus]|uniref:Peptidase inhibitor family I36 n=1 Tax=Streptomyces candidus TaxID=67283 RepID=A0A7X0HE11_9ACTN|nr:hypothetical protein [Streptomyces candidus]MBB6435906.1 hypothetical protein [Streptomyces candidus]GHH42915.1 hypothetical protein GCM10018773_28060 [Streptomyces candidus]
MNTIQSVLRSRPSGSKRRSLGAFVASLVLAVPTALLASAAPAAAAQTPTCGSGYVCIYKGDIFDGGSHHPVVYRFYRYGTYNVANLIGDYTVKNCQTGGAGVQGLTGYNGTGSVAWNLNVNNCSTGLWTSLTSTNSVRVYA